MIKLASEIILIKFLLIISVLFFLPKVINKAYKIPYSLTEVILGIVLGLTLPFFFFVDDMLKIFAAIGIIMIFVQYGMGVDTSFIVKKRRFFIEYLVLNFLLFLIIGVIIKEMLGLSDPVSFLISLALITPSTGYILFAVKDFNEDDKRWIEGMAMVGEIIAILLMALLINITNLIALFITLIAIGLLLFLLPKILEFLFKKVFSKLVGTEFSFIFIVALVSAFVTEFIGLHFLIGAFIAGLVSRRFISDIAKDPAYKHVTNYKAKQINEGFSFFAATFAPFYFFSAGLKMNKELFSLSNFGVAIALVIIIGLVKIYLIKFHRKISLKEKGNRSLRMGIMLLPTLVFTFIIADILSNEFNVGKNLFGTLMIYGVLSSMLPVLIIKYLEKKKRIL